MICCFQGGKQSDTGCRSKAALQTRPKIKTNFLAKLQAFSQAGLVNDCRLSLSTLVIDEDIRNPDNTWMF